MSESPIRIAVLAGGRSGEHQVSRHSAASVLGNLDPERYRPEPVLITRTGQWVFGTGAPVGVFEAVERLATFDVVFPALHGPLGEDGTLQSVLELAGVPYVGNGVRASAAGMDKEFTKKLLAAEGIPVADAVVSRPTDPDGVPPEAELRRLGLPVFVKPARAGSSLGVTRVTEWSELPAALQWARSSDPKVLVEAAVPGREIDLAVLERPDGRLDVGPPLEIRVTGDRPFFDYDAKYDDPETVFEIPARLDDGVAAELADLAVRAFRALGCAGLARVDFFLRDGVSPVLNEINTFPGFTPVSQYPRIWQAAGLDYPELLDVLVRTALARRTERSDARAVSG
ncbi:D-alanine--D-alanine ligase [Micromonospora sp. WMMD1102]|uniref:D-alanine--D-alanine ligase family protein n=1 Tax=Micromonospora sp. WMMD1102 TaxID=3016105 RepID=UPI0024157E65|nr:D-alanine--D-alanine ligase family protein [Micromonospora sp. WMMD1102]MDG4789490.1 D-alanine--D-alanine ligase [Micromonospora sp. WMMD1102]